MAKQDFRMQASFKPSAAQLQRQILESRQLRSEALWQGIRQFIAGISGRAGDCASRPGVAHGWHDESRAPTS